jgi:phage-related protein
MKRKLVRLVAKLVNDFSRELCSQRVCQQAGALSAITVSKQHALDRSAIAPNFVITGAPDASPEHIRFDELWFGARTTFAGMGDTALEQDFRVLAVTVIKALKARVSEAEICTWQFRNAVVSPAFVKEMREKAGL